MSSILRAFEGEPKTALIETGGRTVITVEAQHLPPYNAKLAAVDAFVAALAFTVVPPVFAYVEQAYPMAVLMIAGLLGYPVFQGYYQRKHSQVATVRFTERAIELMYHGQWSKLDRNHPHRFVLLEHDKARDENDELDYQRQRASTVGQAKRVRRYFSDSYIVAFEYLGQRCDIAEVMGRKEAAAIVARLTLCDEYMNGLVSSRRIPLNPADEWGNQVGSLPD